MPSVSAPDSGAAVGSFLELFRACDFLSVLDLVGQPIGSAVKVEDEAEGRVGHLFNTISGHVTYGNTEFTCGLKN